MKFRLRLTFTLLLAFLAVIGCLALFVNQNAQLRTEPRQLDLGVRRSGDSTNDSRIPALLRYIFGQSQSRDLWETLRRNRTVADAWIQVGHVLERRHRYGDRLLIIVEQDPGARTRLGYLSNQDVLDGILDANKIDNLQRHLYKKMGYKPVKMRRFGEALLMFRHGSVSEDSPSYQRFRAGIRRHALYTDISVVNDLLWDMATKDIVAMSQMKGGTQIKLKFTFSDGNTAIFKPMRFPRGTETWPNHFYFSDFERHIAEIAAFHLDRVLDFRRVPPVTGRVVNITRDIWQLVDDKKFEKTIFISPIGNVCFSGKCDYYCDTGHAICGRPELLEGSMAVFLSEDDVAERNKWRHPWRRSYSKHKYADWETDPDYCIQVRQQPPYTDTKRMLDLMDMAVFDFLTGNMDRHHYESFADFGNNTFPLLFDNGRGFGKSAHDELSILAPVYQCCMLRASTLHKILLLHTGPEKLSDVMRRSLANDPLPEVLNERHLAALDRRVEKVLSVVSRCLREKESKRHHVIIDDGL